MQIRSLGIFNHPGLVLGFLGIKFHFPDLNPFHWIRDWLKDLYVSLGKHFDQLLLHPPRMPSGAWQYTMLGESLGLTNYLWNVGLVLMLVTVMFWQPQIGRLPRYLAIGVTMFLAGPYLLVFVNWLNGFGDSLAQMLVYKPQAAGQKLLLLPDINNILGLSFSLVVLLVLGFILGLIVLLYVPLILFCEVMILPTSFLSALTVRAQRWFEWLVQMMLVATVFGRAAAVGWMSLAKLTVDKVPWIDQNGYTPYVLAGALLMAIVSNVVLLIAAHYGYNQVSGKVKAYVQGTVTALEKRRQEVVLKDPHHAFESAMRPVNVSYATAGGPSVPDQAYSQVLSRSASAVHTKIGGTGHQDSSSGNDNG